MPKGKALPLYTLKKQDKAAIVRIADDDQKFVNYLATLKLLPGTTFSVEEKAPFNGPIIIRIGRATYALDKKVASSIRVKKI